MPCGPSTNCRDHRARATCLLPVSSTVSYFVLTWQSSWATRRRISGMILGLGEWSSRLEQRGDYRWLLPRVELVGKLGQAGGPSFEQVRFAAGLRQSFKRALPWTPAPPALTGMSTAAPQPAMVDVIDDDIPFSSGNSKSPLPQCERRL